ncbi:MAG: alternative ribosome rescue aminoacyl-tRNA hydrolase ArfB [Planctomycetota bacterium]|nr:alternative ribosome rescue aminoacyl-tRNA hydrolase ArfB [Planctomycetota bacterium]
MSASPRPDSEDPPRRPDRPATAVRLGNGAWCMPDDLRWSFARSGGPGGQNVNKVSTKAELRVAIASLRRFGPDDRARLETTAGRFLTGSGDLLVTADETRSQADNRELCLTRLKSIVTAATTRPKIRKKTKPSRGAKERRLKEKRVSSEKKQRRNWKPGD